MQDKGEVQGRSCRQQHADNHHCGRKETKVNQVGITIETKVLSKVRQL